MDDSKTTADFSASDGKTKLPTDDADLNGGKAVIDVNSDNPHWDLVDSREEIYKRAIEIFGRGDYKGALMEFKKIPTYKDVDEHISRIEAELTRLKRAKRKLNSSVSAEEMLGNIESAVQYIVMALPAILSIIFGIILFVNKEQIDIISSFGGWCTGWVFFSLAAWIASLNLLKKRLIVWSRFDETARLSTVVVAILSVIFSVIVFTNSAKLEPGFDPPGAISFTVREKEDYIEGSQYKTVLTFDLKNNGSVQVSYIEGEMRFFDKDTEIDIYTVRFDGTYNSGESYRTTVEFSNYDNGFLYETAFSDLKITYRITKMEFNDDYESYEYNGKAVTIKQPSGDGEGATGGDEKYLNTVIPDIATLKPLIRKYVSDDVLVPEEGITFISYSEDVTCYNADYTESFNNSAGVFFQIEDSYVGTLVDDFRADLTAAGYDCVYDNGYSYEYQKGTTHIVFAQVQDSVVSGTHEYYYWNYSAYIAE